MKTLVGWKWNKRTWNGPDVVGLWQLVVLVNMGVGMRVVMADSDRVVVVVVMVEVWGGIIDGGHCKGLGIRVEFENMMKMKSENDHFWLIRVVHSSHFRAIFSSFLISFLISFSKNECQNEMRMNQKMDHFWKIKPFPCFCKNDHFHFHFSLSIFVILSNPALTCNPCSDHHHQWWHLPPSHLYCHHNSVTTCHHHSHTHSHAWKNCEWLQMTHFGHNASPNDSNLSFKFGPQGRFVFLVVSSFIN